MHRLAILLSCLPRQPVSGLRHHRVLDPRSRRRCSSLSLDGGARPFATTFELPVEDGLCVALQLPLSDDESASIPLEELHELERQRLESMKPARQLSFAGGRVAMRRALSTLCTESMLGCPVLPDELGAPTLPEGMLGSISHTHGLVAAVVSMPPDYAQYLASPMSSTGPSPPRRAVGIDVESAARKLSPRAAQRCLADEERATLARAPSGIGDSDGELLLRVSIKEALYKALHPLVRGTIRWHSVQVQPQADGACDVNLDGLVALRGSPMHAEASWCVRDGYVVALARASMPAGGEDDNGGTGALGKPDRPTTAAGGGGSKAVM